MRCPNCLSSDLEFTLTIDIQPHGEIDDQEHVTCNICGSVFSEEDMVTIDERVAEFYQYDPADLSLTEGEV